MDDFERSKQIIRTALTRMADPRLTDICKAEMGRVALAGVHMVLFGVSPKGFTAEGKAKKGVMNAIDEYAKT